MARTLGIKYKQPDEVVAVGHWGIDFDPDIATGDSLSTVVVVVRDADATDVTSTLTSGSVVLSGTTASIIFKAGTDGEKYTAEFQAVTTNGATIQAEFDILVAELQ